MNQLEGKYVETGADRIRDDGQYWPEDLLCDQRSGFTHGPLLQEYETKSHSQTSLVSLAAVDQSAFAISLIHHNELSIIALFRSQTRGERLVQHRSVVWMWRVELVESAHEVKISQISEAKPMLENARFGTGVDKLVDHVTIAQYVVRRDYESRISSTVEFRRIAMERTTHLAARKLLDTEHSSSDLVHIRTFRDEDRALAAELRGLSQHKSQ